MSRFLFPQSAILHLLERLLTTPFYCCKFAPFCERHSFLCIETVCWWKNEAYTDWYYSYYSILLLSVIINSVMFVTGDFIFAKMECITKLLDKNVTKFADISKPFLTFPLSKCGFCEICYSCYFCHICCSKFSHRKKNSCYFCHFCEICGHLEALLYLSSPSFHIGGKILVTFGIFAKFADISKPFSTFSLSKCRILWNLLFLLFLPYLLLNLFT